MTLNVNQYHRQHRIIGPQNLQIKPRPDYFNRTLYPNNMYTKEIVKIHNSGTTIMPWFPTHEGGYVRCKALIDSGASISIMQQRTLQNILKQGCIKGTKVKIHHKELAALFQGKAEIKQCYRFKIVFQSTPTEIDFHIINNFGVHHKTMDLILGRD